jgi:hypothetical protein
MSAAMLVPLVLWPGLAGRTSAGAIWSWYRSADHGIPYQHSWITPLVAVWGLVRSLVFAPYPYAAPLLAVIGLTCAGVLIVGALVGLRVRQRRQGGTAAPGDPLDTAGLALWIAPLALFGVSFFPSDTERWVIILPAIALLITPRVVVWRRLAPVLGLMVTLNVSIGLLPDALDDQEVQRAREVRRALPDDALLVSPGHGWVEQAALQGIQTYPLVYYAGSTRDLARGVAAMHDAIEAAHCSGRRVFVARLQEDPDPRGFKELGWLGMSRADFAAQFRRYRPRPAGIAGVWELRRSRHATSR